MKTTLLLASALVAVATSPAFANSDASQASKQSVQGAFGASTTLSTKVVGGSSEVSKALAQNIGQSVHNAGKWSQEITMQAFAAGSHVSTVVFTASKSGSQTASNVSGQIVTSAGHVIHGSLEFSGKYARLAINGLSQVAKAGSQISTQAINGSVHASAVTVKWSAEHLKTVGEVLVDASGKVYRFSVDASGKVIASTIELAGELVDASGKAVTLAKDASGKIWVASNNSAMFVITTASGMLKNAAQFSGKALRVVSIPVKAVVAGSADVVFTFLGMVKTGVSDLSQGKLHDFSKVMVMMPSELLKAALYSDMNAEKWN